VPAAMIRCIQKFSELIRSAGGLQQAQQQSQTLSGKQQVQRPHGHQEGEMKRLPTSLLAQQAL